MKFFVDRVKYYLEKQGFNVFKVIRNINPEKQECIDLITMKNDKVTFICASNNGHCNLNQMDKLQLQMLGRRCGAKKVLYAKVNGDGEIVFFRIYER